MLKIYGSLMCPDCVRCKEELDRAGVAYEYYDFSESLANLKVFLGLRDKSGLFDPIRREGKIGIPCILKEDGEISLDWDEFV